MEGVEILFAREITRAVWNEFVWHWGAAFAVLAGLILLGISLYHSWNCSGDSTEMGFMLFMAILLLVGGGFVFYIEGTIPVYDHTEYKVTVNETVDMNEFFEKYELVDQEGKIYIVKDEVPLNEE